MTSQSQSWARRVGPPLDQHLNANQILRFKDWIRLAGVSPALGWKLLHSGEGPKFMRLGEKRIGVRVADHNKWAERLAREAS